MFPRYNATQLYVFIVLLQSDEVELRSAIAPVISYLSIFIHGVARIERGVRLINSLRSSDAYMRQ